MKYLYWGLLWPLFLFTSESPKQQRRLSGPTKPAYVQATTKVRSNGTILVNMECQSELFEPNRTVEIELRVYRPGNPVKIVNMTIDI